MKTGAPMRILLFSGALLILAAAPAAALSDAPYIAPGSYDVLHLLPPPPAPGSEAERKDIETVVQMQQASTPERMRLAQEDAVSSLDRFATVLGPKFTPDKLPALSAFFRKVIREAGFATALAKDCWERPRPFVFDQRVHPPGTMQQETANRPGAKNIAPHDGVSPCPAAMPTPAYSYSYPSGHSTFGAVTANLLSEMVPEKRAEIFARGWQFGESRIVGGVHYPSDVEAGRIDATAMVAVMMLNRDFQADLAVARAELRDALSLSP